MSHKVRTTHIQRLIDNARTLAALCHGSSGNSRVGLPEHAVEDGLVSQTVEWTLEKAIADLRHAADELDAERMACRGFRQV